MKFPLKFSIPLTEEDVTVEVPDDSVLTEEEDCVDDCEDARLPLLLELLLFWFWPFEERSRYPPASAAKRRITTIAIREAEIPLLRVRRAGRTSIINEPVDRDRLRGFLNLGAKQIQPLQLNGLPLLKVYQSDTINAGQVLSVAAGIGNLTTNIPRPGMRSGKVR